MKRVDSLGLVKYCARHFLNFHDYFYNILLDDDYIIVYELAASSLLNSLVKDFFPFISNFRFRVNYIKETNLYVYDVHYSVRARKKNVFHLVTYVSDGKFQHTWHF